MKELDKFIVLFDAPGIIGGDYMFMSNCWRYVIPTWDYGRIEVDVFKENYLLLPEQKHRIHICNRLNTAGYSFQIIGELKFINIKRLRAKKSRKSRYRHCPTDMRCTLTANGITGICIST